MNHDQMIEIVGKLLQSLDQINASEKEKKKQFFLKMMKFK